MAQNNDIYWEQWEKLLEAVALQWRWETNYRKGYY